MSDQTTTLPSLIPIPGKVYLRRVEPASAPSPFIVPDSAKEKSTEAVVVAVPREVYYEYGVQIRCPVEVGEKVLLGKYAGDWDLRGEKVTVVRYEEILGIIEEPVEDKRTVELEASQREQREILSTTLERAVPRL